MTPPNVLLKDDFRSGLDLAFAGGPNLFGQGAELRVERFEITSVNES